MSRSTSPVRAQPIGLVLCLIRLRGAGAAAPTVEMGPNGVVTATSPAGAAGVTSSRAGVGDYTLTFSEKPGVYVGSIPMHRASTPSATTKRFVEVEEDTLATTSQALRVLCVTPATDAAAAAASDLASTDVVDLLLVFRTSGTNPL